MSLRELNNILASDLRKVSEAGGLEHLASEAANNYIESEKEPTESIQEIAGRMELNPNQISRIVELTNLLIWRYLLDDGKDRTTTFPLADRDKVMKAMGEDPAEEAIEETKVASDYFRPPNARDRVEMVKQAFDYSPEEERPDYNAIWKQAEDLQFLKERLSEGLMEEQQKFDETFHKIAEEVKQHMFSDAFEGMAKDRMMDCVDASMKWFPKSAKDVGEIFATIADRFGEKQYIKDYEVDEIKQACEGPDYGFSSRVPTHGSHALEMHINDMLECRDKCVKIRAARGIVDKEVHYLVTKVIPTGWSEAKKTNVVETKSINI